MESNKKLNDLIIITNQKLLDSLVKNFPMNYGIVVIKSKKIRTYLAKNIINYSKKDFSAFFLNIFVKLPEVL